jgi:AbiV family abortive infection protein
MAIPAEAQRPAVTMFRYVFEGRSQDAILRDLSNGIVGCTRNAGRLLGDAAFLVQTERYATATFVTTTAAEEIAKAYILLDGVRVDFSRHTNVLKRLCHAFHDHIAKHAYYSIHRFPKVASMEDLKSLWEAETVRFWSGGPSENGEPDMPHDTYFSRELPLYVNYSDYASDWIIPENSSHQFEFEALGLNRLRTAEAMLRPFLQAEEGGLFEPATLDIVNAALKRRYINGTAPMSDVQRVYQQMAERVGSAKGLSPESVFASPLGAIGLYVFV